MRALQAPHDRHSYTGPIDAEPMSYHCLRILNRDPQESAKLGMIQPTVRGRDSVDGSWSTAPAERRTLACG